MADPQLQLEGKAWWVQLQHDRAVSAGCQFYTYRTVTGNHSPDSKQDSGFDEQQTKLRPSTTGPCSSTFSAAAADSLSPNGNFCMMRPSTSAHLPARRSVGSRQGSGTFPLSTAVSRPVPLSRGNDWSPVHSRPVTRSHACSVRCNKPPDEASAGVLPSAADPGSAALIVEPTAHASRPPLAPTKQQRPFTSPSSLHRPSSLWQVTLTTKQSSCFDTSPKSCTFNSCSKHVGTYAC